MVQKITSFLGHLNIIIILKVSQVLRSEVVNKTKAVAGIIAF